MPVIMGICWSDSTRSNVPFSSASSASLPFPTLVTSKPARTRLKQITPDRAVLSSHTRIFGFCVSTAMLHLSEPKLGRLSDFSVSVACRVRGRSNSLSTACRPNLCCHPNIHRNLQAELGQPALPPLPRMCKRSVNQDPNLQLIVRHCRVALGSDRRVADERAIKFRILPAFRSTHRKRRRSSNNLYTAVLTRDRAFRESADICR